MAVITRAPETIVSAFFNEHVDPKELPALVKENNILLSWIPKDTSGGDEYLVEQVQFGDPAAVGPTREAVQAIQATTGGSPLGAKWIIPWGGEKAGYQISLTEMKLSRNKLKKFLDTKMLRFKGTVRSFGTRLETYLWRPTGRYIGYGTFTSSTGVIQLSERADSKNFKKGQLLQISTAAGASGDSLVTNAGIGYVIAVNGNAGTVTVAPTDNGTAGAPSNWVNSTDYYYFNYREFGGTASPYKIIDSIFSWIPTSDPASTAFNNIDRTQDIVALSGVRLTSTEIANMAIDQRLLRLVDRCFEVGYAKEVGGEHAIFIEGRQWQSLANRLRSYGQLDIADPTPTWGFSAIKLRTQYGTVPVYAADRCPNTAALFLSKNSMKLVSVGELPEIIRQGAGGDQMFMMAGSDDLEMRWDGICALAVTGPGANGYTALEAVA
jgi:hypothetical protein